MLYISGVLSKLLIVQESYESFAHVTLHYVESEAMREKYQNGWVMVFDLTSILSTICGYFEVAYRHAYV